MAVDVRLLGPLEIEVNGVPADAGPPQQRALLALLALRTGRTVPVDVILTTLWADAPPETAGKIVQTYVSRLRKTLGYDSIDHNRLGYSLNRAVSVDAMLFRERVAEGELNGALELWRGDPLEEIPELAAETQPLRDIHLSVLESSLEHRLDEASLAPVVAELQSLVNEHPARERSLGLLVLALYRDGRQADALAAYRDGRRRLMQAYGLEPSAELRELERRVLRQDPALGVSKTAPTDAHARRRHRRPAVLVAAVAVAAVAVSASFVSLGGDDHSVRIRANSLIAIDARTNRVVASIPVGRSPSGVDATTDAVWVASEPDRTVERIDLRTHAIQTIGESQPVTFVAHDARGNIYASAFDAPFVWQIDPERVQIVRSYRVSTRALGLVTGGGSVWVVDRLVDAVTRIDLAKRRVAEHIPVGKDPLDAVFGYGALWVANSDDATISVIRPGVSGPSVIRHIPRAFGIAAGSGAVWVASHQGSVVYRIDPDTRRIVARIRVAPPDGASELFDVAAGAGAVWAVNRHEPSLVRIDPRTNTIAARIAFPQGTEPRTVTFTPRTVWVTVSDPADDG